MKYLNSKVLCFVMVLIILLSQFAVAGATNAPELPADMTYDAEKCIISYNGNAGIGNELISITVIPDDFAGDYEDLTKKNSIIKTIRADAEGHFSGSLDIKQGKDGLLGKGYNGYTFEIKCSKGVYTRPFTHINKEEAKSKIDQLNAAPNYPSFFDILDDNEEALGLSAIDTEDSEKDEYKMLHKYKPTSGYTVATFYDSNRLCSAIVEIKGISGESSAKITALDALVTSYADVLTEDDVPIEKARYENKEVTTDAVKLSFIEKISALTSKQLIGEAALDDIIIKNLIMAECVNAINYNKYRDIVFNYKNYMTLDLTKYDSSELTDDERNNVFSSIFTDQPQTVEKIKELFNSYVETYYTNNVREGGGNEGGNGGGSSGGGGGFSPGPSEFADEKTDEKTDEAEIPKPSSGLFPDTVDHWAKEYIQKLYNEGKISGYEDGSFMPEKSITRAEFTKIVIECFGISTSDNQVFNDVNPEDWYFMYASAAYDSGILKGSNGSMRPNDLITREEVAAILYRVMILSNGDTYDEMPTFTDTTEIADYALIPVGYLQNKQIILGDNGYFRAASNSTRAEAVAMICRAAEK